MTRNQKMELIGKYLDDIKDKNDKKALIKRLREYEILVCVNNRKKYECGIMNNKIIGLDKFINSIVKEYEAYKERHDIRFSKYICPICGKELIRLEPFEEGEYRFWCDTCNIDITIEDGNVKNSEDESETCISEDSLFQILDGMISNETSAMKKSVIKNIRDTIEDIFVNCIYG